MNGRSPSCHTVARRWTAVAVALGSALAGCTTTSGRGAGIDSGDGRGVSQATVTTTLPTIATARTAAATTVAGPPGISVVATHAPVRDVANSASVSVSAFTSPIPTTALPDLIDVAIRTTIYDAGVAPLALARPLTTRWWGVVSSPRDGAGPFPLAIVLHGAHRLCATSSTTRVWPCPSGTEIPNYEGLAYLTDALARRGFIAIAPGINAEFSTASESSAPGDITVAEINRVLEALRSGQPSLGVAASRVDLSRVVLVGHSRGAALAAMIARTDIRPALTVPVGGVVLVAPSDDTVDPSRLADVAAVVAIGTCDGDTGVGGGEFVAAALGQKRSTPVALVMIDGATHNATDERLAAETMPDGRPGCGPAERLEPIAQRQLLAKLVPEWARQVLGASGRGQTSALFDSRRPDDRAAAGLRVVHVDPAANRRSLLPPDGALLDSHGSATSRLSSAWCPSGRYTPFSRPGTDACHRLELADLVGRPAGWELTWDAPGSTITVPVYVGPIGTTPTTAPTSSLTSTAGSPVLVVRALPDPVDARSGAGPVVLRLTGSGPGGLAWTSDVELPVAAVGAVDVGAYIARRGAVLWSERRLPLPNGLTSLTITVLSPAGSLLLVGLEVATTLA